MHFAHCFKIKHPALLENDVDDANTVIIAYGDLCASACHMTAAAL